MVAGRHGGIGETLGTEEIGGRPTAERAEQISSWTSLQRESTIKEGTLAEAGTTPSSTPLTLEKWTSANEDKGIPRGEDIVVGLVGSELQMVSDATGTVAEKGLTCKTSHLLAATAGTGTWPLLAAHMGHLPTAHVWPGSAILTWLNTNIKLHLDWTSPFALDPHHIWMDWAFIGLDLPAI